MRECKGEKVAGRGIVTHLKVTCDGCRAAERSPPALLIVPEGEQLADYAFSAGWLCSHWSGDWCPEHHRGKPPAEVVKPVPKRRRRDERPDK